MLQCVAVYCNDGIYRDVLDAVLRNHHDSLLPEQVHLGIQGEHRRYNTLRHIATRCNTLQYTCSGSKES